MKLLLSHMTLLLLATTAESLRLNQANEDNYALSDRNNQNCKKYTMDLLTDNYGSEITWDLKKSDNTAVVHGSGYKSNTGYKIGYDSDQICLNPGDYVFTIN